MLLRHLIAFLALALLAAMPARADRAMDLLLAARAGDAVAVLRGEQRAADVFTERFNAQVPPAKLAEIAGQLTSANGRLIGADEVRATASYAAAFQIRLERARADATIQLDPVAPYRISGFFITAISPLDDGPQRLLADFAALPGRAGFAIVRLGGTDPSPVLSLRPHEQFAVGSTFKLWVLDAVAQEVADGRLRWEDVVRLGPRSLPSGVLQDWPAAAPLTVETLATLMISQSDNTATDTLIRLIGRERVEARVTASGHSAPAGMVPFLTTAEAFALKSGKRGEPAVWAGADAAARRAMLAALGARTDPSKLDLALLTNGRPQAIREVEWFASANDAAAMLDLLRRRSDPRIMAILAVNSALPPALQREFVEVGFKGGSEAGVFSLNWLVRNRQGQWFAVSASWNDPANSLDEERFRQLAFRLVGLVK